MTTEKCPFCGKEANHGWFNVEKEDGKRMEEWFDCTHCGFYEITNASMLPYVFPDNTKQNTYYVSCYLNETKPEHDLHNPIRLSSEVLKTIIKQVPKTIEDKVERLLQYIYNRTNYFGETVELTNEVIYSFNDNEIYNIKEVLNERGLTDDRFATDGFFSVSLTMDGLEAIRKRGSTIRKDKCFIAMWFNDDTNAVYDEVIAPTCVTAGYEPVRVDRELYNGDITDKIISLIRTTAFTVADYTGDRGGVYFEAGFAKGLGKEVIMICRDDCDWFDNKEDGRKVHFDVNHINMIVWNNDKLAKFNEDLTNRIIATIGKGSYEKSS